MPRPVRIAICQFASEPPTTGSVSNNFARLDTFVSSAAAQGAHLIVFPEYFLTGTFSIALQKLQFLELNSRIRYNRQPLGAGL